MNRRLSPYGTQVSAGGGYAFNAGVGEKARADARIIVEGVKTTVQQSRTSKSDCWVCLKGGQVRVDPLGGMVLGLVLDGVG